ncbi:hypothetical protein PV396_21735 [Streptomyces sp. ME02-8801-2C]|uniref:hypothetical protein n=1 Tax=Streptomyces sp. ME02-8801-2C TaxID=3028680 RepID=UPI00299FE3DF|nr:hypothetical protein [Streptomyces sp. ME02-8801-2C]MDX3454536.1 hypothetical protein [Streptomyces sp. ME02-8801-2C]
MRSDVWIGDLLRALPLVEGQGEAAQRKIARLLGFDLVAQDTDSQTAGADAGHPAAGEVTGPALLSEERTPETASRPRTPDLIDRGTVGEENSLPLLVPSGQEPSRAHEWTAPSLPLPDRSRVRIPLPHEPLLAPRSTSAMLHRALSKPVEQGQLDVRRVVDRLSRGLPLETLPRRPVRTLRFGVQVLADLGLGMEPFSRDLHDTIGQVTATVGREHTEVVYFDQCPVRGAGPGPRWTWGDYAPPAAGTRVLILSDLGTGGPSLDPRRSTRAEWERLLQLLSYAQCTAVAFVPLPEKRWPSWAANLLPLVPWDRQTTVGWIAAHMT